MTITLSAFLKQIERDLFPGRAWQSDAVDRDLTAPPGTPATGARYIIAAVATGAWAGKEEQIATYTGSTWTYETPAADWLVWVTDEAKIYHYDGNDWVAGIPDRETLSQDNLTYHATAALERYSNDSPGDLTIDVAGDGGNYYAIATALTSWVEGFSQILSIEYPAATIASDEQPQYLEPKDWEENYWVTAAGVSTRYLYLPNHSPAATEYMRIKYSLPYTFTGSPSACDVPPQDFYAVCYLAAGLACQAIATKFSQIGDSTINADSTSHTTKADEFRRRATEYIGLYEQHLGLGKFSGPNKPAAQFINWDTQPGYPGGRGWLFHDEYNTRGRWG